VETKYRTYDKKFKYACSNKISKLELDQYVGFLVGFLVGDFVGLLVGFFVGGLYAGVGLGVGII
jgi:hypothetical protein